MTDLASAPPERTTEPLRASEFDRENWREGLTIAMSAARSRPAIDRLRAFPAAPAPNDDPSKVKSNLAEDDVRLCQNVLAYHIAHHPDSRVFGHEQASGLTMTEVTVNARGAAKEKGKEGKKPRPDDFEAVTVCELTVQEGELSPGVLHPDAC